MRVLSVLCFCCMGVSLLQGADLPKTVMLKTSVTLSLMMDGKSMGSISVPAGKKVKLLSQFDQGLKIAVGAATGTVLESDTDFDDRVAQLKKTKSRWIHRL